MQSPSSSMPNHEFTHVAEPTPVRGWYALSAGVFVLGWLLVQQQALHWQVAGIASFTVALTWLGVVAWLRRHPPRLSPRARAPVLVPAPARVADRSADADTAPVVVRDEQVAAKNADFTRTGVRVVFASQTGFAEQLARQTAQTLGSTGMAARLDSLGTLGIADLQATRRALFVVSTTGDGDAPDVAEPFFRQCMAQPTDLSGLQFGLLALGDSDYDAFCGFGHKLEQWLRANGARALFDLVEVDSEDESALRQWQHRLALLSGRTYLPDWQTPRYQCWQLVERHVLNPGSAGEPCFQIALRPAQGKMRWEAGDLVEIGPCHAPSAVTGWLAAQGLDGAALVTAGRERLSLAALLARSRLPAADAVTGLDADAVAALVQRLPHREYSIASLPADGALHLLVRRKGAPDGVPSLGSGWLTEYAEPGAEIALRVRRNVNFHMPANACPLILIGNGTGMAALHALLAARIAAGRTRNWLLFGERQATRDFYYREQIEQWLADG